MNLQKIYSELKRRNVFKVATAYAIATYGNRLFFDLEDAPNTAARLREAGIDVSRFKKMPWVQ